MPPTDKRRQRDAGDRRPDFAEERSRMVQHQIRARGVRDQRVLDAMLRLPREKFVPEHLQASAYEDHPLSIGCGQTISQPYMVALMTEALELSGRERVLEIGTGSGYQTAILAELADEVYTVERVPELSQAARQRLAELGYANVRFHVGDGTLGWPEEAPFDRILVTAGAPEVPPALTEQLADDGLLVIPVGNGYGQDLLSIRRRGDRFASRSLCRCVFVKLIGEQGWR